MFSTCNISKLLTLALFAVVSAVVSVLFCPSSTHAISGSDWRAGRIIDDSVMNFSGSMSIAQIQYFLNAKVPNCDNWGTQAYAGTTRRAYSESRGIHFPLTCLKDYHENTSTHENNLEGRGIPAGAKSAANIIWDAAQQYSINPQVLLVMLQKEQALVFDDWPWPVQYRSAMGYGCPDSAPCDTDYYGFYNQVNNAARQMRRYATYPNQYNFVPGNNFIQYNPNASCGGSNVYIENQATASLYNYTPYQPNQAALNSLYGTGDSCSAYGNRNFWRMFNEWFGSSLIFDPFGWDVIRTADDGRYFLVVGNTKRWIPTGEIYDDWKLSAKPVRIVSQAYMDSIPTIPALERLGYFNGRYYYVDGGKKYWLSNDELLRAWGQINKLHLAAPAYIPLSTIPDGGEATFYISQIQQGLVGRLIDGQLYRINANDADRWHANPTSLSTSGFGGFNVAATLDYHVLIDGVKYLVDDGRLLNVNDAALLRDYDQTNNTFVAMPNKVMQYLPAQNVSQVVKLTNSPHWYVLFGGNRYYVPNMQYLAAWRLPSEATVISPRLSGGFPDLATPLPTIVKAQSTSKIYMLDGTRHEVGGVMYDAIQSPSKTILTLADTYLSGLPVSQSITSPIIQMQGPGHIFTMANGNLYHVPNADVLHGLGYPRKYDFAPVAPAFIDATGVSGGASMFMRAAGTTYFLQDGNAFPLADSAKNDWLGGKIALAYSSSNFANRFDNTNATPLQQRVREGMQKLLISGGRAISVNAYDQSYATSENNWQPVAVFGLERTNDASFLARNTGDGSVWLVDKGAKQYILSSNEYFAYSKNNTVPITGLSTTTMGLFGQVGNGVRLSPFVYTDGQGAKLLESDGSFFGFGDGSTLTNFMAGNTTQNLSATTYSSFNQFRRDITRLIRDPSGKVYWVENGKKRWISSPAAFQQFAAVPITDIGWNIVDWLPNGTVVN